MTAEHRPLAVVTGASTGIGYELAKCCARQGFDLIIAAEESAINDVAQELSSSGVAVTPVQVDLATSEGVGQLVQACAERPVDALLANAGRGLGESFLDQPWDGIRYVIDTNIIGTMQLVHQLGRQMRERNRGRILITGSIAGVLPGAYHAVYNGTKAFLDNFSFGLRQELAGSAVTVTCLMPGPTETAFFDRAHLNDTRAGTKAKDDAKSVARAGFAAMMAGKAGTVTGWQNKLQVALARLAPAQVIAKLHGRMMEPGSGHAADERSNEATRPNGGVQ